jgi:uncharacterized metal-binding protein YceD (DUF177 family)
MSADVPEFSRVFPARDLLSEQRQGVLTATAQECAALARRFDLAAIAHLRADYMLSPEAEGILLTGKLDAAISQYCAVSGEPFDALVTAPLHLRFVDTLAAGAAEGDEIELAEDDCDEMLIEQGRIDVGEAIAQSLLLALDPYPEGPGADHARAVHGLNAPAASGPFAALAALRLEGE